MVWVVDEGVDVGVNVGVSVGDGAHTFLDL